MNTAKAKALEFMMTDVECIVRDFKEDCQTQLTSRESIRTFSGQRDQKGCQRNPSHACHWGLRDDQHRAAIRDALGKKHSVVIVKTGGDWTREIVQQAFVDDVLAAMGKENEFEREVRVYKNKDLKSRRLVSRETIRSHVSAKLGKEVPEKQLTAGNRRQQHGRDPSKSAVQGKNIRW